jgi:3-oxoacyl-[acyl-carrier-protein] synthase II
VKRPVVVTGMAIRSPYGDGLEAFWDGLLTGRSAAHGVRRFPVDHWVYRSREGATIEEIPVEEAGEAEFCGDRLVSQLAADIKAAARVVPSEVSRYEVALAVGSSHSGVPQRFQSYLRMRAAHAGQAEIGDLSTPLHAGAWLTLLAAELEVGGPALMVSTACTSGTSSIGIVYEMIRDGRATRGYAGGLGYFSEIAFSGFNILKLIGRSGCRPFDAKRDGLMLGDGFALVCLEDEAFARARGAPIFARIVGYASGNEAYHATSPDPAGETALRIMWEALNRSDQTLARLDYINAHGTGTPANDAAEIKAIRRLLERRGELEATSISSTKGHHGHSLGAAGSIEFVATVLALTHETAPPNCGLEEPEREFAGLDLVRTTKRRPIDVAMSNSFAFGGNVAAIVIEAVPQ